jgi:hypothetical protein
MTTLVEILWAIDVARIADDDIRESTDGQEYEDLLLRLNLAGIREDLADAVAWTLPS